MKALADLHVHSDRSDGLNSPQELVEMAERQELGGIALTDHDTLAGIREFLEAPISSNLQRVPGVEVSTKYLDHEVHLLGYFVPFGESPIELSLHALRKSRHTRFPKMVKKLRDLGIEIDESEIQRVMKEVPSPGRPHLARILIDSGVVRDIKEAINKYLASGKPAFVSREKIELIEAIGLLRESGAVPVIAHPLLIEGIDLQGFLRKLNSQGLEGVEVNYDYRKPELMDAIDSLRKMTEDLGLIVTGGSDSHGDEGHSEIGSVGVPVETIDILRKASERIQNR